MADEHENRPLDSYILLDTDYLRQYLSERCDLMPEDIEVDTDEFEEVCDQIVDAATADNKLHDLVRDTVHESWLWESLSDMIDDVVVDFMTDEIERISEERMHSHE